MSIFFTDELEGKAMFKILEIFSDKMNVNIQNDKKPFLF